MQVGYITLGVILSAILSISPVVHGKTSKSAMQTDLQHVKAWNQFAHDLFLYHKYLMTRHDSYTQESTGGYAGLPDYYREVRYYDKASDKLLSRIQWEVKKPQQIHVIEVFVYDKDGVLKSDYLAAYLPEHRNAPIQTLVNLHYANDELKSFRQFDASGARIYEHCSGKFFGEPLTISLEEDDFGMFDENVIRTLNSEAYLACFEHTPHIAAPYLSPLQADDVPRSFISANSGNTSDNARPEEDADLDKKIDQLSKLINTSKNPAAILIERGRIYFLLHEFDNSVRDYTEALKLDDSLDEAYFGRGMSRGRLGMIKQGIEDLSIYIQRNPSSSRAYTKRGVRYIWAGDLQNAKKDLLRAIELDVSNAEAHDDIGVVYASAGDYKSAISHFQQVIEIDPSYQKGFHNLAMAYQVTGEPKKALHNINAALSINPADKNSLLLKGEILNTLGMKNEAQVIIERAEFLPDGNWSERFSMQ